jgi:hypothetical protein
MLICFWQKNCAPKHFSVNGRDNAIFKKMKGKRKRKCCKHAEHTVLLYCVTMLLWYCTKKQKKVTSSICKDVCHYWQWWLWRAHQEDGTPNNVWQFVMAQFCHACTNHVSKSFPLTWVLNRMPVGFKKDTAIFNLERCLSLTVILAGAPRRWNTQCITVRDGSVMSCIHIHTSLRRVLDQLPVGFTFYADFFLWYNKTYYTRDSQQPIQISEHKWKKYTQYIVYIKHSNLLQSWIGIFSWPTEGP